MYQVILTYDEEKQRSYYYSYYESADIVLGNISVATLPPYQDLKMARSCYLGDDNESWIYDASKYEEIKIAEEEEANERLINISDNEKLILFASLIQVAEVPEENGVKLPKKEGYIWNKVCTMQNGIPTISWVLEKDPNYLPSNDGSDYLKAINWNEGDPVIEGLWYNVGNDLIWQAIKSGIPGSAEDSEYFDIV